jgi:hypothetical protein
MVVFERTFITVVFSEQTEVPQLYIYQVGSGDRTIPKYDIISSDERFAQIEFFGNLSGLDIDITNMQNK